MPIQVSGTWRLKSFQIEDTNKKVSDWGKNAHGLLIYTEDGYVSVSINKAQEAESEKGLENLFSSILFYSGTYQIEDNIIKHQVTEASNPSRIGKEMIRYADFKDNLITLITPEESFGRAIIVWKRVDG